MRGGVWPEQDQCFLFCFDFCYPHMVMQCESYKNVFLFILSILLLNCKFNVLVWAEVIICWRPWKHDVTTKRIKHYSAHVPPSIVYTALFHKHIYMKCSSWRTLWKVQYFLTLHDISYPAEASISNLNRTSYRAEQCLNHMSKNNNA